ncbi:MAG TPA: GAF domain-containing sensor histidine kinase [Candidatus Eisenbacteria bacterium]|nr:GAF domain-containing sensor histidine kinase [Candidatus Eisenbacteria bacterium]
MKAPIPANETERLKTLRHLRILDTPPEITYDDLTLLASEICGTPIAAISLVDSDRQWFKSKLGLNVSQTPRDVAFCAHAILNGGEQLIVEDATKDERFFDSTLVTGSAGYRFYAGTPLVMSDGNAVGTLCVVDRVPRRLTDSQKRALEVLGREVVAQMELRRNQLVLEKTVLALARTEAELRRTQQEQLDLKDKFISHVSHELRSPLTPIYQFATILLDEIAGPVSKQQRDYLEIILRNASSLQNMINDLLEVTRAQTGKLTVDRRRMHVGPIVTDLVRSLAMTAKANGLTLSANVEADLPEALGDKARVRQVVANLIENAMKFTPEGGAIHVNVRVRPEQRNAVCITVSDTGCGLSANDRERVFEQLYQVEHAGGERSRNGLGLGLYISKELVNRQGGRIWVESEKGQGSHFSFTLPILDLGKLIAPLLTETNMAKRSLAVISVDLLPASGPISAQNAKAAMDEAYEAVGHSIHPAMDIALPRFGSSDKGETIIVIAMADEPGAERIVERIEERLAACASVQSAGFGAQVTKTVLLLPETVDANDEEAVAAEWVRMLNGHVDDLCREGVE